MLKALFPAHVTTEAQRTLQEVWPHRRKLGYWEHCTQVSHPLQLPSLHKVSTRTLPTMMDLTTSAEPKKPWGQSTIDQHFQNCELKKKSLLFSVDYLRCFYRSGKLTNTVKEKKECRSHEKRCQSLKSIWAKNHL